MIVQYKPVSGFSTEIGFAGDKYSNNTISVIGSPMA
jgi:hypothetical protein